MMNTALRGKPDAGNPHVRFDEGEVAPAKPRRGSLLYKSWLVCVLWVVVAVVAQAAAPGRHISDDYLMSVSGKPVEVVRVPMPENRLAPLERQPYSFASFEATGTVEVCVRSGFVDLSKTEILPKSKGVVATKRTADTVAFEMTPPMALVLEPRGRHRALVVSANLPEARPPDGKDPKVKFFGPGFHHAGQITLGDGETLYLASGAWVEGWLQASGRNMTVCGSGVLSGAYWDWNEGPKDEKGVKLAGRLATLSGENIVVRDVTLFSSWGWTLVLNAVTNALVDNVKVIGGRVINDDGMDICRARDVELRNSFVRCQDDCVTPKWWCENLVCTNMTLWTDAANVFRTGYECESGASGLVYRNLLFRDIDVLHQAFAATAPSDYWAHCAIYIQPAHGQAMYDAVYEDIRFHEVRPQDILLNVKTMPITVGSARCLTDEAGSLKGLTLRNIHLPDSHGGMRVNLSARDDAHPIEGVRFENVTGYGPVTRSGKVEFHCAVAEALDGLLPRPVKVEAHAGALAYEGAEIRVKRASVAGAPAAVCAEAYALDVMTNGVTITASDPRGERYARVTLAQIAKLSGGTLPCCRIVDWPVLRWRGYMNDCGRNYLALEGVKAILDVMAAYKLNLFHWHLADYHGWRLESKKYPQLQKREAFLRQVGKYYTQDEFREIVAYAAERGITVMPELDVPGHTLALRRGLGVKTMADPGVEEKVADLFRELCSLAPADVMPFVHLGTDEARTREETCDDRYVTTWAKAVNACGRKAVVWAPGKRANPSCDIIDMAWYDNHVTNSVNPFFYADYVRFYNGSWSPFDVLSQVTFADPRHWKSETARQIGAIGCTWHDDNVGEDTTQLFRDCMVFPSLLGFADNYWSGRPADRREYFSRLPFPGDALFDEARELERRLARHRDLFFADFRYPFPFVRQTDLRWRITDLTTGKIVARDVPQGTVWIKNRKNESRSFLPLGHAGAMLETWIRSPEDRTVGAWIDCACYFGAYTRLGGSTPQAGEWNRAGAKVCVNGIEVAPPKWKQPGMVSTVPSEREQDVPYSTDLLEKQLIDELPTLRPPTKIALKKGWNYVRIVLPKAHNWGATFCPIGGTSEHPCEVSGLEYSSEPRNFVPKDS